MTDLKRLYEICANQLYIEACMQVALKESEDYDGRWIRAITSIIDLHPDEEYLEDVFKNIMEEASNLKVRLVASSSMGKDWYDAK